MKKFLPFIVTSLIITIPLVYYLFFWKNLSINNPDNFEIIKNQKKTGNEERVLLRTDIGGDFIISRGEKSNIFLSKWTPLRKTINATKEFKSTAIWRDTKDRLVTMIAPTLLENNIFYIGGRQSNYILGYDIKNNRPTDLYKKIKFSVSGGQFNKTATNALLVEDDIYKPTKKTVYIYNIQEEKYTKTEFSSAQFINETDVIGIKNKQVEKFKDGKYTPIGLDTENLTDIAYSNNTLVGWNQTSAVIYTDMKKSLDLKLKLGSVKISPDGKYVVMKSGSLLMIYDTIKEKLYKLPLGINSFGLSENKLIFEDIENNIWLFDCESLSGGVVYKLKSKSGEIFGTKNYSIVWHDANYTEIGF